MSERERGEVPPWRQVADDLRRRIESGEFPPGAPVPSAAALSAEYGVSRSTAAKAVTALKDEGLIVTVRGWGAFIRR
jgi:DNA-binding GntR family transcriptional regulator